MSETLPRLSPRPALRATETDAEPEAHDDTVVALRRLDPRARFSLRLAPSLLARASSVAGFALDLPINRCRIAAGKRSMRLGPDEWLLSGPEKDAAQIAGEVETSLAGLHHALVDVGHARVGLSMSGPRAADVINRGCALDLSATAFPAGSATRTLLGKAEIVLSRWHDAPAFEIECARSFAAYVRDFLSHAARQSRVSD